MRLPGAGSANEHDIVCGSDEFAVMELADQGLVDLAAGEVEAGEIAVCGDAVANPRIRA